MGMDTIQKISIQKLSNKLTHFLVGWPAILKSNFNNFVTPYTVTGKDTLSNELLYVPGGGGTPISWDTPTLGLQWYGIYQLQPPLFW